MLPVSIVIIALNEEKNLGSLIPKLLSITDDIVLVDTGSTDKTVEIANSFGAKVIAKEWDGYGSAKNTGNKAAKYDWVLSLDADEYPDSTLIDVLQKIDFSNHYQAFDIAFQLYFEGKQIRHGNWGSAHHIRLFNRTLIKWSDSLVHEDLVIPRSVSVHRLPGHIHHYSVESLESYRLKINNYANLSAIKYYNEGKEPSFLHLYLAPAFNFLKNYVFRLGFLDGREGWLIAKLLVFYTWEKYHYLKELYNLKENLQFPIN